MLTNYTPDRLRFGAFIAPYHPVRENPTLALERDFQLVELLDQLDFDEAWIGEHHSGGYEIIASPELFIAAAAERTRRMRLGTGVSSLSYHNPMILADRLVQLDHQTRGRLMCGFGPGQLPSDAIMLGIDPARQRDMMAESLECIIDLLDGKCVNRDAGWFKLVQAQLQLLPYQAPRMDMAVACAITPNGPVMAGRHGLGMLSVAASAGAGFAALPEHWELCEAEAAAHGKNVSRRNWRVVVPMHIAETRELARSQVISGIDEGIMEYLRGIGGPSVEAFTSLGPVEALTKWEEEGIPIFGRITVGNPNDAAARIEQLQRQSGGFGSFLILALNIADWAMTRRSYELFARYVMPRFQHSSRRQESLEWSAAQVPQNMNRVKEGIDKAMADYRHLRK